ncbi:MAG: hypothetical protein HYZ71_09690 [Deltaproteobacteria bacterium]|nr:hypothetical protein [Deltaproteobacteria bacterium]
MEMIRQWTAPTIVSPGPDRTIANQEMEWLLFHATARGVGKGTHPTSTPEANDRSHSYRASSPAINSIHLTRRP